MIVFDCVSLIWQSRRPSCSLAKSKWTNRSEAEIDEVKATSEHDECEANGGVARAVKRPSSACSCGEVKSFTQIVENCSKQALVPIIKGQVLSDSIIYTDGWKSYDGLVLDGYKHFRIHHHQNQSARGKNHVNGIESFWSFTKMRLSKLRGIRSDFFILHLKESEWRINHPLITFTHYSSLTFALFLSKVAKAKPFCSLLCI